MTEEAAPIVEVAQALASTIANPSIPILAGDLLLAHQLANEVNEKLKDKHPSIRNVFQFLFNLT